MQPSSQNPPPPAADNQQSTGEELKSNIQQVGSSASNRLHSEVDARKGAAATQAKSVSSAIERAADGLDEGTPAWLRSAFQQGAQQIQRFADTIETQDSRQLVNQVSDFARNNPTTFLLGCAAAGFAAARVFKAGASDTGGFSSAQPETQGFGSNLPSAERPAYESSGMDTGFTSSPRGEFA